MPVELTDVDVTSALVGSRSALIVPCYMCPAVTVATRENKPFMKFFRSLLKSLPFEQYLGELQSHLAKNGIRSKIFRSNLYHQWFMCMWTAAQRTKLKKAAKNHEAIILLGCDSATETVREAVRRSDCKVIEGMKVSGIMNATLKFSFPCDLSFGDCRIIPISK